MAIEKTVELNVETTQAQKALNKFGGTLEDVYGEGVQPLNFAIGELEDRLYEMAAAGNTSSKEFNEMAAEVGRMKKVIIETDMTLDGMAQTTSQKVGGAISGLAGGFSLVQGAMGAFGVESEAVQETLLRVQSAMAISEGIQTIKETAASFTALGAVIAKTAIGQKALNVAQIAGAAAMKVLNAAMSANPIMLIVGGITALVGALAIFGKSTESAEKSNEKLNASLERQNKALELNASKIKKTAEIRRRVLELNGATEEELHKDTLKRLKEEELLRLEDLKNAQSIVNQKNKIYIQARREGDNDLARSIKEEIRAEKDKIKELRLLNKDYRIAVKEENKRFAEDRQAEREAELEKERQNLKQRSDAYKTYQQNRLAALRLIQDLELELNADEIEANNLKYERLIEDTKKNETLKQEEKQKIIDAYERLRDEKDRQLQYERAEREKWDLIGQEEIKIGIKTEFLDREIQSLPPKRVEVEKQLSKEELQIERDKQQAKMQMASDALGAISQLVTAFAGENEEAQRKAFNINKAISIGQAIINTAQAVTGALAEPSIVPGARFVKAGIAAATGAAQIATISRTQFQSAGAGGIDTSSIRTPQISQQAPTFNIVGDNGVNQLASTLGSQPMKAYVVAGDVTTAQSLERNKIEQSKL